MTLYIGQNWRCFYITKTADTHHIDTVGEITTLTCLNIIEIIAPATAKAYDFIFIDVTMFSNDAHEIAETLIRIQKTTNATIVIECVGLSPKSTIMIALYNAGFRNFIQEQMQTQKEEECYRCLTGFYEFEKLPFEDELISCVEQDEESDEENSIVIEKIRQAQKRKVSIGIAGCMSRIGTTTQAIQIVKYLTLKGYNVCYIEINDSGWLKKYIEYRGEDE